MNEESYAFWFIFLMCLGLYGIFRALNRINRPGSGDEEPPFVCSDCGNRVFPRTFTPGNLGIELLLWLLFLLPGLIYSAWRLTSRYSGCPVCHSRRVIPVDSPMGQKIMRETHPLPHP